jgi:hypothetical protein
VLATRSGGHAPEQRIPDNLSLIQPPDDDECYRIATCVLDETDGQLPENRRLQLRSMPLLTRSMLEAFVTRAGTNRSAAEQVILVGDHQQLTPFCNVKWLGQKPYYLDTSRFERRSSIWASHTSCLTGSGEWLQRFSGSHIFGTSSGLARRPCYLDLSRFERRSKYLGIPYIMLDGQRRTAPEIRAVVDSFYHGSVDHPVALKRDCTGNG